MIDPAKVCLFWPSELKKFIPDVFKKIRAHFKLPPRLERIAPARAALRGAMEGEDIGV